MGGTDNGSLASSDNNRAEDSNPSGHYLQGDQVAGKVSDKGPLAAEVLFDGPSGEHAPPQDGGSLCSVGLGEEEIHLVEMFLKTIRANPDKVESLYGKFEKMVEEEEKDQDGSGANLSRQPSLMRSQRTVESKTGGVPGAELGTRDQGQDQDQDSGL